MSDYTDGNDVPWALYNSQIKTVSLGDGVTAIDASAFNLCDQLTGFTVTAENANFSVVDGILFNKDLSTLVRSPATLSGAYVIPESVTEIGESAFAACNQLTSVTIPNSVTSIPYQAFSDCGALTTVTLPDTVHSVAENAFEDCYSLSDVYYGGSEYQWTIISFETGNDYLTWASIHFAKDANSGSCGEDLSWDFDTETGTLTITGSGEMDDYTASTVPWANLWSQIKTTVISASVTSIGDYAFSGANNLTTVIYNGSNADWLNLPIGLSNIALFDAVKQYAEVLPYFRYNLISTQAAKWTAPNLANHTSIWNTTIGHSQNISGVLYNRYGRASGIDYRLFGDHTTSPFLPLNTFGGMTSLSGVRNYGLAALGATTANPGGYQMKIVVPATDTYTFNSHFFSLSQAANEVTMYIAPASASDPMAEEYLIGTVSGMKTSSSNLYTFFEYQGVSKELLAGEYIVSYSASGKIYGGSLTIFGTTPADTMTLTAEGLNESGALEVVSGESVTVALNAVGSLSGTVQWETADVREVRADTSAEAITASFENGMLTVSATKNAVIGDAASITVYLAVNRSTAWVEIPIEVLPGAEKVLNLSHVGNLDSVPAYAEAFVTLNATIDGVATTFSAEDTFNIEVVDKAGNPSGIATAYVTVDEAGNAKLFAKGIKGGDAIVKLTATVSGVTNQFVYEIPLHVDAHTLEYNFMRLQWGQWSANGLPFTRAASWGWEQSLSNWHKRTSEKFIFGTKSVASTSSFSWDSRSATYGPVQQLAVGDTFSLMLRINESGNYALANGIRKVLKSATNSTVWNTTGVFELYAAPVGASNPTAAEYLLGTFTNAMTEEEATVTTLDAIGTALVHDVFAEKAYAVGDYELTVKVIEATNTASTASPVSFYWHDVSLVGTGKTWLNLGGGNISIIANRSVTIKQFSKDYTYNVIPLEGSDVISAFVDSDGNLIVETGSSGSGSFLVEATNADGTASGAAIYNVDIDTAPRHGSCGGKLNWKFDPVTSELILSGTGAMNDYTTDTVPWKDHIPYIKVIRIPSGITSIGKHAFNGCNSLLDVFFDGLEADWNDLSFGDGNDALQNANRTYSAIKSTGICGENLIWTLYENGTFVISGTGPMYDRDQIESFWDGTASKLVIEDGVTSIGAYAFSHANFTKVELPESLVSIGDFAFSFCHNLTELVVPEGVVEIGSNIIESEQISIRKVTLPSTLTTIAEYAFANSSLEEINLPANVEVIPQNAFDCTYHLKKITVDPTNTSYTSLDGNLYNKAMTKLLHFASASAEKFTVPSTVTEIGDYAFAWGNTLREVIIPSSVETIGAYAFHEYTALQKVTLSEGLRTIGQFAFSHCNALSGISIPKTVTHIYDNAFYANEMEKVVLSEGLVSIGAGAFSGASGEVTIPKSVVTMYPTALLIATLVVHENSYAHQFAQENEDMYDYIVIPETENPNVSYGMPITGKVTDMTGIPLPGIKVSLYYQNNTLKESVVTDSTGAYTFSYAEVGTYTIRASADGTSAASIVDIKRMNNLDVVLSGSTTIKLKTAYIVTGMIQPTGKATVSLTDTAGNIIDTVVTENGVYSFTNIPNGNYIIKAETENGSSVKEITVWAADLTVSAITILAQSASITGTVVIKDRNDQTYPVDWAQVTLYNMAGVIVGQATTAQDGTYTFKNLPLGNYYIAVKATEQREDLSGMYHRHYDLSGFGYVSVTASIAHHAKDIVLSETSEHNTMFGGKVTAHGSNQECEVTLDDIFRHSDERHQKTGKNGKYTFQNVSDGLYTITARTQNNGMGFTVVMIANGRIYGNTDITVAKDQKISARENALDQIPHCANRDAARKHKDKIAEEKRHYDALSDKEKQQLSASYIERLLKLAEWITELITTENGGELHNASSLLTPEELQNEDAIELILDIEKTDAVEISNDGIMTEEQYLQQAIHDTAGDKHLATYYDISLTKKTGDKEDKITHVAQDTDTSSKIRITMPIPDEYKGHKHYHFIHIHNGVTYTLADLDADPDTITFEIDRFSTFALTYTDVELVADATVYDVTADTVNGAQIRTTGKQGLRFISSIDKTTLDFNKVIEFGTLLLPTDDLDGDTSKLTIGYTNNGHTVAKVVAEKLFVDNSYETQFTAVLTGIPPAQYTRSITARAYAILEDGTVVYGDTTSSRSIYEVAVNGRDNGASGLELTKFLEIIAAVEGTQN